MNKVKKVMHEYKEGELHSGSKKGPIVHNRKQAIAIALSEARKSGAKTKVLHHKVAGKKTSNFGRKVAPIFTSAHKADRALKEHKRLMK